MLIRSQDKRLLIDLSNRVIGVSNEFVYIADNVCDRYGKVTFIGQYATEERAVEVLGKIQDSYEYSLYTDCNLIQAMNVVFEMPEE